MISTVLFIGLVATVLVICHIQTAFIAPSDHNAQIGGATLSSIRISSKRVRRAGSMFGRSFSVQIVQLQ